MKTKAINKSENLLTFYYLTYTIKYLRCILLQAQIEKEAMNRIKLKKCLNSQKLFNLNLKHNKLAKGLYDQKIKIINCA